MERELPHLDCVMDSDASVLDSGNVHLLTLLFHSFFFLLSFFIWILRTSELEHPVLARIYKYTRSQGVVLQLAGIQPR